MTDGSVLWCGLWFLRKIRPTQLWVELNWVVAISWLLMASLIVTFVSRKVGVACRFLSVCFFLSVSEFKYSQKNNLVVEICNLMGLIYIMM